MEKARGWLAEFKAFAARGNVIDMAVGVIIGGAFSKIVASVVNDLLMPVIGVLVGGMNFSDLAIVMKEAQGETEAVLFKYGAFIQTVIDFLIIAWCVFLLVKLMNRLSVRRKKEEAPPPPPPAPPREEVLLAEIRDLLKEKN